MAFTAGLNNWARAVNTDKKNHALWLMKDSLWLIKDYFWWFDIPLPALFSESHGFHSGFIDIKNRDE